MLLCMRTTVNIDDQLLQRARLRVIQTNRTLTSIIEDGWRRILDGASLEVDRPGPPLPVSGSGGLLPRIDLDDSASLLDRMDGRA